MPNDGPIWQDTNLICVFCLLLWFILRTAPERFVNPLKKIVLIIGLILLIQKIYDFNETAFEYIQESTLVNFIRNNFDKSDEWFKGLFDGFYSLISAVICVKLFAMEFLSKKTKK